MVALALLAVTVILVNVRGQSKRALKLGQQTVQLLPGYANNSSYCDRLAKNSHDQAFNEAYGPPSTTKISLSAGSLAETKYQESLIRRMIELAAADGRKDIEQELVDFYKTKFGRAPNEQSGVHPTRSIATSSSTVTARRHSVSVHA